MPIKIISGSTVGIVKVRDLNDNDGSLLGLSSSWKLLDSTSVAAPSSSAPAARAPVTPAAADIVAMCPLTGAASGAENDAWSACCANGAVYRLAGLATARQHCEPECVVSPAVPENSSPSADLFAAHLTRLNGEAGGHNRVVGFQWLNERRCFQGWRCGKLLVGAPNAPDGDASAPRLIDALAGQANRNVQWGVSRAGESKSPHLSVASVLAGATPTAASVLLAGWSVLPRVYDLASETVSWSAKNRRDPRTKLEIPVRVVDATTTCSTPSPLVVTADSVGKLLFYDRRAQRRPVSEYAASVVALTALASDPSSNLIGFGDAGGLLALYDVRAGRVTGRLPGPVGAVQAITFAPASVGVPWVAACGLDRYVRVYDKTSRQPLAQIYAKQKQSTVAFLPSTGQSAAPTDARDKDDDEDDQFWSTIPQSGAQAARASKKRRQK